MKLFLDCEFNGFGGELISLALVPEMGEVFYQVLDTASMKIEPWVRDNVMPHLVFNHRGHYPISPGAMTVALGKYLRQWTEVTVVADWPDDFRYLMGALITGPGMMVATPGVFTMELRRDLDYVSELPHNALADAIAIRAAYKKK